MIFFSSEFSVDFHGLFVGIAEKEEISVGFVFLSLDLQFTGALKELRILYAHRKPVGIFTDICVKAIEGASVIKGLVAVAGFKDVILCDGSAFCL